MNTTGNTADPGTPPPAGAGGEVPFWNFLLYFLRLGTTGFGGPIATVGYMQRDLVEQRGWVDRQYERGEHASQVPHAPKSPRPDAASTMNNPPKQWTQYVSG